MEDKPNRDTDPVAWLAWFKERQRVGVVKSNKARSGRSESAHKAWKTKRKATK